MKYDLIITRHAPLYEYLREMGIIDATIPVLAHVSDPSILDGKHVIGVLPHSLSSRCASVTEVPLALTLADREAMTRGDLSLERMREIAGAPVTYVVTRAELELEHAPTSGACYQCWARSGSKE